MQNILVAASPLAARYNYSLTYAYPRMWDPPTTYGAHYIESPSPPEAHAMVNVVCTRMSTAVALLCALTLLSNLPHITSSSVSSYPSLPFLFAEGSHYDVGRQIVSCTVALTWGLPWGNPVAIRSQSYVLTTTANWHLYAGFVCLWTDCVLYIGLCIQRADFNCDAKQLILQY